LTNPKGEKPESDHPYEDEIPLELQKDPQGLPAAGVEHPHPLDAPGLHASTEEFHFSGPAEELDFTEPTDFTFPPEQSAEVEQLFGAEEGYKTEESTPAESFLPKEAAVESELTVDEIADVELAEEPPEEDKKSKPKFELPAWVRIAEWVMVGVLAASALLTIICSIIWVKDPARVTLVLNIACAVMLGLIPYTLWRARTRWLTCATTYTIMLALSIAALIIGTWFEGQELSRYHWQFTKARVSAGKLSPVVIAPPAEPATAEKAEPATDPAAK